jgi:ABC-type amino acid transport substrate-binding protein
MKFFIIFILFTQFSFSKDVDKILNDEYIRVGVKFDYKPFGFINSDGKIDGFEIDLIKSLIDRLNIRVKLIEVTSKNKEKMLLSDKVDIVIAGMILNNEDKNIIFTKPYFYDEQVVLVNSTKNISTFKELKGLHIGSIKGSEHLSSFLKIQPDVSTVTFTEYPQLIKALSYNNIDAITADASWAKEQVEIYKGKYKIINDIVCNNKYSIAVASDNIKLKNMLDSILIEVSNDGTYKKIYNKWFK